VRAAIDKRAVFAACAKNCAATLPRVLANIDRMAGLFAEAAFVFVENDSRDATKRQLADWCETRSTARLITRDGLDAACPIRTIRLARLRSEYISLVSGEFGDRDYLFVIDCDEVNEAAIDLDAVARAVEFLARSPLRSAVFANTDGYYYDMWALRHAKWCPADAWEEVLDYVARFGVSDSEAFANTFAKRILRVDRAAAPVEVVSAFGGLAIYKVASVRNNARGFVGYKKKTLPTASGPVEAGLQVCEHVSFNTGIHETGGKLYILPYLVNFRLPTASFPPSWFRTMLFDLRLAGAQPA
jgi:hypothetical protein